MENVQELIEQRNKLAKQVKQLKADLKNSTSHAKIVALLEREAYEINPMDYQYDDDDRIVKDELRQQHRIEVLNELLPVAKRMNPKTKGW